MTSREKLSVGIREAAHQTGFSVVGIAPAVNPAGYHRLLHWLQSGFAADMKWMERRQAAYQHPDGVMPGTRSVIMAGWNYFQPLPHDVSGTAPRIARYALGPADYHDLLKLRLQPVVDVIRQSSSGARCRVVVDTAPLLERDFARLAGIGWFGKNTMLISRQIGSWFLLGAVLTDAELDYDQAFESDFCGSCTRCLDACPTDAFPQPGVLDAGRCISYQTIENRFQPIPAELRSGHADWLFGCDVCQEVCPWNRFAPHSTDADFQPRLEYFSLDCCELLTLDAAEFEKRFRGTPLYRSGRAGLLRNAAVILANAQRFDAVPLLLTTLLDQEPLVRGASAWALGQLAGRNVVEGLQDALKGEHDAMVITEIQAALQQIATAASG